MAYMVTRIELTGEGKVLASRTFKYTISGEHGIRLATKAYLTLDLSTVSLVLQKQLKRRLDPQLILNRGKLFD